MRVWHVYLYALSVLAIYTLLIFLLLFVSTPSV